MPTIHIVTDSLAHFSQPPPPDRVTIVPNILTIGGQTYREGVDIAMEEGLRLIAREPYAPRVAAPTEQAFAQVYTRLARDADAIVSLHPSRELSQSWHNARQAAAQLMGHCTIEVIDTQTLSVSQAMLVRVALNAAQRAEPFEEVVRVVRGAIDRVYSVYYVETLDYLLQNGIMPPSQTVLGTMLGIKPFLTVEHGRLLAMEKVRTRAQAVERLVEFAVEFTDLEDAVIVQHKPHLADQTRMLLDRLAVEFPAQHFSLTLYGPSLAALIGTDATGLVILEKEPIGDDDDF